MIQLILLILLPALVSAIPGIQCGGTVCLDDPGKTTCDNGVCKCNEGMTGNGRFECVDEQTSCLCYLYGDPYVTGFQNGVTIQQLPCRVIFAEYTTPNNIYVKVTANASRGYDADRNYPSYVFEDGLNIKVSKGSTFASADLRRDGFYRKGLKVPSIPVTGILAEFGVYCSAEPSHFWSYQIMNEGIKIRYRSAESSLTIEAPKGSTFHNDRICGDCEDESTVYQTAAAALRFTKQQFALSKALLNLDSDHEDDDTCRDLGVAYNGCDPARANMAVRLCGAPYNDNVIGSCFREFLGNNVLKHVKDCFQELCSKESVDTWCAVSIQVHETCPNIDFGVINNVCLR